MIVAGLEGGSEAEALKPQAVLSLRGAPGGGREQRGVARKWGGGRTRPGVQVYITDLLCKSGSEGSPAAQPLRFCLLQRV